MKKIYLFAAAALALASCTSDEYLGDPTADNPVNNDGAILFAPGNAKMTRANHTGADAASMLNNQFTVEGSKTVSSVAKEVFDDYLVKWTENTAGTTESNTSDWEYVGITAVKPSSIAGNIQTIKYWDDAASQYDFAAYSTGAVPIATDGGTAYAQGTNVYVTPINYNALSTSAYKIKGAKEQLAQCYISDLVTAYKGGATMDPVQPKFRDEVKLTFRSLASKARLAFYETIPGYSVKDVKFYTDASTTIAAGTSETSATLFTTGSTDADNFFKAGVYTINFPTIGSSNVAQTDYNKAHVSFAKLEGGIATTQEWGALGYRAAWAHEPAGNLYLGHTSADPTFAAGEDGNHWVTVLPNETGTVLALRVDYTLVSEDGSNETITVHGATAYIPAIYAAWKSNYAYTYIFKISDNTNGWTSTNTSDPTGLYPITFDAVVTDAVDGSEQTTITTVATPSITTYQKGHLYTVDNEYSAAKGKIYVQVMNNDNTLATLNTAGQLYTLNAAATEADVISALNMSAITVASGYNKTGRNGVSLKVATSTMATTIPGIDGNDITVSPANTAAEFTPSVGTYAYVYTVTAPTSSEDITTAVSITSSFDFDAAEAANASDIYYTDEACTVKATGTAAADGVYYQKYTKNNGVYAVKVIKVVA